jgi:mycothiol synthase
VNVRRPAPADLDDVLALVSAADLAALEETDWTREALAEHWAELDLERNAWLLELDGRPAAYATFEARGGRLLADGYVHPELRERGLGSELIRLTEERAAEAMPPEGRVYLQNATLVGDACTPNLYARHGYEAVRHFYRMVIDLDDDLPEPRVPEGIELRLLREPDEREALYEVLEEPMEDHWEHTRRPYDEWARRVFGREGYDPTLVWVAAEGGELVAASSCGWKQEGDWGWVGVLGVRRPRRRRGIAEALLLTAFREFRRRGERRVALGVDAQSPTGATRLYERVGMRVFWTAVVYEKELRAG